MDSWSKEFEGLLNSPLGKELVRTLKEDLMESILEDARKAESAENAYGLLKESAGVIRVLDHLQFRSK